MTGDVITLIWLIGGIALLIGELVLPGLVAMFLGAAAVLVAGLRWVGLIESVTASLFAWMGLSVGLTLGLRSTLKKYLPSETSTRSIDEGIAAFGARVEVVETVSSGNADGRIRYQGTSWPATTMEGTIPKGAFATLVVRENLAWIVEPADPPAELPATLESKDKE